MENSRKFGYGRTSSTSQDPKRQILEFKELGIEDRDIYIDQKSGKDFNREQYNLLKKILRSGDILYLDDLDRLGRNYSMILKEWHYLIKEIGIDIIVISMPLLNTTLHKDLLGTFVCDLVLQVLSFNAHKQRESINRNQRSGILASKAAGVKFGRPKIKLPDEWVEVTTKWGNKEITAREAMKILNLKPNTFYNFVKNEKK